MIMEPTGIVLIVLFGAIVIMGVVRMVSDSKAKKANKEKQGNDDFSAKS